MTQVGSDSAFSGSACTAAAASYGRGYSLAQRAPAGRAPRGAMRAGGWLAGNAAAATADAANSTLAWLNLDCSVLCSAPPAVSVGAEAVVIEHSRWLRPLGSREKSNDYFGVLTFLLK